MRRIRDIFIFLAATVGVTVPAVAIGIAAGTTMLAAPSVAQASPQQVIRDCAQDGKLDRHYSLSDLKNAEKKLPTDVDEYTNCRDVINQAEVQGSGGKSNGSSLHGEKVMPGHGGVFKTAGSANSLPVPVLLALIAVIALAVAGAVVALKRRFPEVFGAALRIIRR
jgi:hypothetical protein